MATLDITGTAHHATVYSYTDPEAPYGITTWWGWHCTCGKADKGIDRTFARDLTRMHRWRVTPCLCGNTTVTIEPLENWLTLTLTCDCGFTKTQDRHWDGARPGQHNHRAMEASAAHWARYALGPTWNSTGHSCIPGVSTHDHANTPVTIVSPTATRTITI